MKKPTSRQVPVIGVVLDDERSGAPLRKALADATLRMAFEILAADLENGIPTSAADIILVAGSLRSGPESFFSRIRDRFPDQRLVACIQPDEARDVRWAIVKGADGVVWESEIDATLGITLRAVHLGLIVLPRDLRRQVQPPKLTNREKQTLSLVIMGLTNREIAQRLFLSESTIKSHLNSAFRKLGVGSRSEAARLIADPEEGLGTGILAITGRGLARQKGRK
jgi:DNA-binding NarL/FixJ family response regulator